MNKTRTMVGSGYYNIGSFFPYFSLDIECASVSQVD